MEGATPFALLSAAARAIPNKPVAVFEYAGYEPGGETRWCFAIASNKLWCEGNGWPLVGGGPPPNRLSGQPVTVPGGQSRPRPEVCVTSW